jgi:8-oxo-dGTP diphosphatase
MRVRKVAAGIIWSGEKVLLTRRKPGEKLAGYWEFPGGKIEENETIQQCLEREIQEELNINIRAGSIITTSLFEYTHGAIELVALAAEVISGNIHLVVHDKFDWVPIQNLLEYNLAPADIPIAKELIENDRRNRRN